MSDNYEHLFEFAELKELDKPVLILALDGWIDSSGIAHSAKESLQSKAEIYTKVKFNTDRLLEHRARRPVLHLKEGVVEN